MSEPKISIRASYARLAMSCAGRHDIRYYLNGILVQPRTEGGAFIVGTDGHRMVAVIDEKATCSVPTILSPNRITEQMLPRVGAKAVPRDTTKDHQAWLARWAPIREPRTVAAAGGASPIAHPPVDSSRLERAPA